MDNTLTDVLLNEVSLAITASGSARLIPFTTRNGLDAGVNTLELLIHSLPRTGIARRRLTGIFVLRSGSRRPGC